MSAPPSSPPTTTKVEEETPSSTSTIVPSNKPASPPTKPTKTTTTKKKTTTKEESYSSTKHWIIGIFVFIGIIVIAAAVYSYEAWKHHWIPFGEYVTVPPPGGVQPTTLPTYDPTASYPTRNDRYKAAGYKMINDSERGDAKAKLQEALYNNCAWICAGEYKLDTGTVELHSSQKPNVTKGILKPSYDTQKGGCDCTLYQLPPVYPS